MKSIPGAVVVNTAECGWCGEEIDEAKAGEHITACKAGPYSYFLMVLDTELLKNAGINNHWYLPKHNWIRDAIRESKARTEDYVRRVIEAKAGRTC